MKLKKENKTPWFKKIFIKICRLLGYEIIDQSNFYLPVSNQNINEDLSKIGKRSLTIPMGEIKITRQELTRMVEQFRKPFIEIGKTHLYQPFSEADIEVANDLYKLLLKDVLQHINEDEKMKLLAHLRQRHGKDDEAEVTGTKKTRFTTRF